MEKKYCVPAERMKNVYASVPRKILERARVLEKDGRKIVHMEIGEPDFNSPLPIIHSTVEALQANKTHYESNRGNLVLRKKIAAAILKDQGISYDAEEEILMAAGVAPGNFYSIMAFVGEGDEVITFAPEFMNYDIDVMLAGGTNVIIPLKAENAFQIDLAEVEKAITPKTKMIIINNPHNPTGVVHDEEILKGLAELAVKYDLLVLSDEVYDKIVYDGRKAVSIASFPGMKERTILLNGFSKAYAMTGWRMGYVAADRSLMTPILRVHQYLATCIPTFTQAGLAESMDAPESLESIKKMVSTFELRRNTLLELLDQIPEVTYVKPSGAFYVMIDVSRLKLTDMDFAMRILEEEGVALCPATAFGKQYSNFVRISYATSMEDIKLGLERFARFVKKVAAE